MVRSRVKLIYHTYVLVSIELQNLYLVPQSILLQLIFGQLDVSLLNCFWARFVPLFCFHTSSRHHHHLLQNDVFLFVSATYLSSDTILSFVAVIPWWKCGGPARTYYKGAWNTHPGGSTLHESQLQWLQVSANKSTPMAQGLHFSPDCWFFRWSKWVALQIFLHILILLSNLCRSSTKRCLQKLLILLPGFCSTPQVFVALRWVVDCPFSLHVFKNTLLTLVYVSSEFD